MICVVGFWEEVIESSAVSSEFREIKEWNNIL